jgi:hypothetical protein
VSVTVGASFTVPPQMIIFDPVQIAVWRSLGVGAPALGVSSQATHPWIAACVTSPVAGSQASVVQAFPSSTSSGPEGLHSPAASQASPPAHLSPLLPLPQATPTAGGFEQTPAEQISNVHGFPSLQAESL